MSAGLINTLFSFSGRLGRGAFWCWIVFYVTAQFLVTYFVMTTVADRALVDQIGVERALSAAEGASHAATLLLGLVLLWPGLAISVKRWHDVDKSGGWVLVNLIPIIGWVVSLIYNGFVAGTQGRNRFDGPIA